VNERDLQQRIVEGVLSNLTAQFPKAVAAYFAQQGMDGREENAAGLADLVQRVEAASPLTSRPDQQSQAGPEGEDSHGR